MYQSLEVLITLEELFDLADYYAEEEGTAFLFSGGNKESSLNSFLFLFPSEKEMPSYSCWTWPFTKGYLVGYLSYEMGWHADPGIPSKGYPISYPLYTFYRASVVLHYSHLTQKTVLYWDEQRAPKNFHDLLKKRQQKFVNSSLTISYFSDTLDEYVSKIEVAKEKIRAGDIYQINLSQEYHLEGYTRGFTLFRTLSNLNPAPFSAYINCGSYQIVSSSPERFLKKKGVYLETRPIKGTMPRGKSAVEDALNRKALLTSPKEKAELMMIIDLMRNDLGKVSKTGSVHVKELLKCEEYTNVFHLLSIIESETNRNSPVEIIKEIFPGGSITGCPKWKAMEVISELEKRSRGIYTGCIGYFDPNEDFDLNIAIRTLVVLKGRVVVQLGGGIVIDSDPLKEYEETLHKGQSLFKALGVENGNCILK